jgi:group II intron reverse transcriptase/maturase
VVVAGLHLRIENGVEAGHVIAIRDLPCKLGRGGQSDVMLADPDDPPAVSRDHARISRQGGRLIFTDHSINGSRVGTRWLSCGESEVLRPGDEIQLGPTLLLTVLREGAPAPPRQLARPVAPASVRPGRLREALTSYETLEAAWHRVELNRGAAGPDNVTVADFARTAPARLKELRDQLLRGRYEPLPPRLFAAPKRRGGVRTISILAVRDRVVQQALHNVLQPLLEPTFLPCSFAYRPALCAHHALRAVDALLAQGKVWIAETDIASFFDNVVHAILLEKLREQAPDPYILTLVARCLAAGACAPGLGIPQGAATSPLFANLYLTCFDQHMTDQNCAMVRYGDDLVIPCTSRAEAQAALAEAEGYLRSQLQLSLKAENTRVVYLAQGFIFLGFEFRASGRRPAPQALSQLQQRLADASPGESQRVVRGWRQYYGPTDRPTPEAAAQKQWQPSSDMRIARRMLSLFVGRQDVYARQGTSRQGKPRFVPCQGSLSEARLAAHLAGTETLAIYLHRLDGSVRLLVLDIDVVPEEKGELDLAVCAREALRVCRQADLPACLEDSGGGGCHLWVFFAEPVSPELARRLGRLLAIAARLMRPGIRVEVFPRQAEWAGADLGDAAKLPLGVHPVTGRRCLLLDDNGEPIADPAVALERVRPIPLAQVQAAIALLSPPDDASVHERRRRVSAQVRKLLSACPVIAHLRRVAAQTGRLRHTHRLILLYTAGRLGEKGARFVHETLAHCQNYSPEITQRHLDRLDPNHQPITCRRIREWLEEEGEQAVCACEPMPQTPLDALAPAAESASPRRRRGRRPPSAPRSPERSDAAQRWAEVAADLFSEEPERPEGLQTEP